MTETAWCNTYRLICRDAHILFAYREKESEREIYNMYTYMCTYIFDRLQSRIDSPETLGTDAHT